MQKCEYLLLFFLMSRGNANLGAGPLKCRNMRCAGIGGTNTLNVLSLKSGLLVLGSEFSELES